jgi:aldose 1-epimerase
LEFKTPVSILDRQGILFHHEAHMKMPDTLSRVFLLAVFVTLFANFSSAQSPASDQAAAVSVGGEPVVTLQRPASKNQDKPHFIDATIAPGRGMNLLQLRAFLPGKGEVSLLNPPSLSEEKQTLDEGDDEFGNKGFQVGAGLLLPYANRIRGTLSKDGKTISTNIAGKTLSIPANWHGKNPGAEVLAMHGLILSAKFEDVKQHNGAAESSVSALFHGGDFGGHWLSKTDVSVKTVLKDEAIEISVTAKNVGKEPLPMGMAFHPWFVFPSGDRKQARLFVPADQRALVNNYDDVVPTGKIEDVKGTPYDFTAPGGTALGTLFMDDNFLHIKQNKDGSAAVEITDPAAAYGLRIVSLSPEVKAFQVYAPLDRNVIVVEPQINLADPYNPIWGKTDTGMVLLQPGHSVSWRVRLELFTPPKSN